VAFGTRNVGRFDNPRDNRVGSFVYQKQKYLLGHSRHHGQRYLTIGTEDNYTRRIFNRESHDVGKIQIEGDKATVFGKTYLKNGFVRTA